jgi:hypothetical protein
MKVVLLISVSLIFTVSAEAAQVADGVDVPELSHFDDTMLSGGLLRHHHSNSFRDDRRVVGNVVVIGKQ